MNYFLAICTLFATALTQPVFAAMESLSRDELKGSIIPDNASQVVASAESGEGLLDFIFAFIRDSIFGLLALIAIGMFIYIGGRLVMARGNQEEFTKALKSLVYAVIGILLVAGAWAIVRFVAGIQF